MRKLLVFLAVCALLAAFNTPSFAELRGAAVNIYGNVRFDTFSDKLSTTMSRFVNLGPASKAPYFSDRETYWHGDWANSRLGVDFKAGDVSGQWEWRPTSGPYTASPAIGSNVRQFWGAWDFGQGKLVVGHTWDPIFLAGACSRAARASGTFVGEYGDLAGCLRLPQIALWIKGFKIAFVQPTVQQITISTGLNPVTGLYNAPAAAFAPQVAGLTTGVMQTNATYPGVHATYQFKYEPFWVNVLGGWEQYKLANNITNQDYSVNSYIYGGQIGYSAGPITATGIIWKCQNPWEFGLFGYGSLNLTGVDPQVSTYDAVFDTATNQVIDSTLVGYEFTASFKINDMFTFAGGYGAVNGHRDALPGTTIGAMKNDAEAYYINLPITLAKNVKVVPEIGRIDEKTQTLANGAKVSDGKLDWFGAWWFIGW